MTPALRAACENAVHVLTSDGQTLRAARATLFILSEIGFRVWPRLLSRRPFLWLCEGMYRLMADHRDFFATFFFRRDHSAEAPEEPLEEEYLEEEKKKRKEEENTNYEPRITNH